MQAAMILFIHQSTLDSVLFFFFLLAVTCTLNAKYPAFNSWKLALLSGPGIELSFFGWALLT